MRLPEHTQWTGVAEMERTTTGKRERSTVAVQSGQHKERSLSFAGDNKQQQQQRRGSIAADSQERKQRKWTGGAPRSSFPWSLPLERRLLGAALTEPSAPCLQASEIKFEA